MSIANIVDISQFSGGTYDRLGEESKALTAISWEQYPSDAVVNFIEAMSKIHPLLGEGLETHGVNYFVIAEGDDDPYSGFTYARMSCTTVEWDLECRKSGSAEWRQILEDEDNTDAIVEAREEFEEAIEKEVASALLSHGKMQIATMQGQLRTLSQKVEALESDELSGVSAEIVSTFRECLTLSGLLEEDNS